MSTITILYLSLPVFSVLAAWRLYGSDNRYAKCSLYSPLLVGMSVLIADTAEGNPERHLEEIYLLTQMSVIYLALTLELVNSFITKKKKT